MTLDRGFTLIELLIVMAIISVMAALGLFMIGSKIKLARDSDRRVDIYEIRLGLEQYHIDQNAYPDSLIFNTQPLTSPDGQQIYLPRVHHDLLNKDPFLYVYNASPSGSAKTYDLCAYRLEAPKYPNESFCLHQMQ